MTKNNQHFSELRSAKDVWVRAKSPRTSADLVTLASPNPIPQTCSTTGHTQVLGKKPPKHGPCPTSLMYIRPTSLHCIRICKSKHLAEPVSRANLGYRLAYTAIDVASASVCVCSMQPQKVGSEVGAWTKVRKRYPQKDWIRLVS